jgi:hypothetical protein
MPSQLYGANLGASSDQGSSGSRQFDASSVLLEYYLWLSLGILST